MYPGICTLVNLDSGFCGGVYPGICTLGNMESGVVLALGLTVRYRWSHQSSRSNSLPMGAPSTRIVRGWWCRRGRSCWGRVGWARCCCRGVRGGGVGVRGGGCLVWPRSPSCLSRRTKVGVFSGLRLCPRCVGLVCSSWSSCKRRTFSAMKPSGTHAGTKPFWSRDTN